MFLLNCLGILSVVVLFQGTIGLPDTLYDRPYALIWNGPTHICEEKFGIKLNFSQYNIIDNSNDIFQGDKMVIFYKRQLGLYPYILANGTSVNGGIPQQSELKKHLMKEKYDVISSISVKNFSGPAVIDWESWRPLFERNFDTKSIYKNRSKRLVKQQHPSWNTTRILREAKIQFETAARNLMVSSLELGEQLRSNGRWGFYGFPRIYRKNMTRTRMNNDRLRWLFSLSSGLYPSIYLKSEKDSWLKKYNYVVQTLDEVFRVFNKFSQENKTLVIPYTRFRYQKPEEIFYTKNELMLSLAIPATKGSAGAILWDSSFDFRNRKHCQMMNGYLTTTLGPFAKNLTNTFKFCSESLCNGNGRCVKTVWNTVASRRRGELGVNMIKMSYNINSKKQLVKHIEKVLSSSNHSLKRNLKTIFSCKCYAEWKGKRCQFHRNSFNITIG